MSIAHTLDQAPRLVLGVAGPDGPELVPLPFWWDSEHLWLTASTDVVDLGAAAAGVSGFVPAPDDHGRPVLFQGDVRIFGMERPVGLLAHGLVVSVAMGALALKIPGLLRSMAQEAVRSPGRWAPTHRVVLRVGVEDPRAAVLPPIGPGIAPALPPELPAPVRRLAGGERRVLLAVEQPGAPPLLVPAVWGVGFTLDVAEGVAVRDGARAAVLVQGDAGAPAAGSAVLSGTIQAGRLRPSRATWWHGSESGSADVTQTTSSIVLPD